MGRIVFQTHSVAGIELIQRLAWFSFVQLQDLSLDGSGIKVILSF